MFGLVSAVVLAGLSTSGEEQAAPGVCAQLVAQIGLKHVWLSGPQGQVEEWRLDTAKLKDYLVGGTVANSIGLAPIDDGSLTGDDYRRFAKMCQRNTKGAECQVVGPAELAVSTKRGVAKLEVAPDDRAIVGIRGTTVYCRRAS